ncbi:MAG: sigma-70 family RNA polymerase sigma factor [Candidatus Aminicenantes bacterium]|jgi:RNA polymerase sigma-70 factor (ECF subfamily)|nr:sigma-70 family RNA polymerase sigma factor [Candidatus Aminicenantes bacterium]
MSEHIRMEEKQLVRLAQEGSPAAFEELVAKYQPKVFSMALSFTRNREAADDLAQEIFLKAYLALPRFHGKSEFGTWLYRISINHIRDFLRKKGRAKEVSLDDVPEISFSDREQAEKAEQERETEARRTLVQTFVRSLPEKYRVIVTLRDIQGLAYEEISRILKLSPGTVDSRLHRARRMLRVKLAPYLTGEGGANELSQG